MARDSLLHTPDEITESASEFYAQHFANMLNFALQNMIFEAHENFLEATGKALSTGDREPREVFPDHFSHLDALKDFIDKTLPVRLEAAISRAVDNFLAYVSDILTQAITARPDLLKSEEKVTLEEVLEHDSIEDFTRWAAERRVNQLSFKGLGEIAQYVEKRLGLKIDASEEDWRYLNRAVAIRNLIVHRRAVIDERFLWAMNDSTLTKGEKFTADAALLADTLACAMRIVGDFDSRVAEKFSIPLLRADEQEWHPGENTGEASQRSPQ